MNYELLSKSNPIHGEQSRTVLVQREMDKSTLQFLDNLAFGKEVF
jgi:hypothetical protein